MHVPVRFVGVGEKLGDLVAVRPRRLCRGALRLIRRRGPSSPVARNEAPRGRRETPSPFTSGGHRWIQALRLAERRCGSSRFAAALQSKADAGVELRKIRILEQRRSQDFLGLVGPAERDERQCPAVKRRQMLGVQGEASGGDVERLTVPSRPADDSGQIRVAVWVRWCQGHSLPALHLGLPRQPAMPRERRRVPRGRGRGAN